MLDFFASVVWGFVVHRLERVTRRIPNGWREMTNYGIGVLAVLPLFEFTHYRIPNMHDTPRHKARIAFVLSFVFFGVGVGIGRILDALRAGKGKDKK